MARGFSLVETVFAIGLLTGALVTLAQLVAVGVYTTSGARYRTIATVLAQQKMEQLRGEATLADTNASVEHFDASGATVCAGAGPCEARVFTARWSIAPVSSAPGAILIKIEVSHARRNYGEARSFAIRSRSVR